MNDTDINDYDFNPDYFVPKMVDRSLDISILRDLPEIVKSTCKKLHSEGWRFYFVKQQRGRCYYRAKVITLPSWAMKRERTYKAWYVAHECSHALVEREISRIRPHGIEFMEQLKLICPSECIIHELEYKPRNAAMAGIGQKKYTFDDL